MSELGGLNPKFWYADEDGVIVKYIYCKLCHAGPFKASENRDKFIFFGMGNKDAYCAKCSSAHNHFQSDVIPRKKVLQTPEIEKPIFKEDLFKDEPFNLVGLN